MNKMLFAFKEFSKNVDFFIILIHLDSNVLESSYNQTLNICHSSETHMKHIPSVSVSHQTREKSKLWIMIWKFEFKSWLQSFLVVWSRGNHAISSWPQHEDKAIHITRLLWELGK